MFALRVWLDELIATSADGTETQIKKGFTITIDCDPKRDYVRTTIQKKTSAADATATDE